MPPIWHTYQIGAAGTQDPGNTTVITKPIGTVEGDLLLCCFGWDDGDTGTITPPSGWNESVANVANGQVSIRTYWKIAGASEPANYTWSWVNFRGFLATLSRIDNFNADDPIVATSSATSGGSSGTSLTVGGVSPALVGGAHLLIFSGVGSAPEHFTHPPEMTERYDDTNVAGPAQILATEVTTASSPGSRTAIIAAAARWTGVMLAIAPIDVELPWLRQRQRDDATRAWATPRNAPRSEQYGLRISRNRNRYQ